MHRLFFGHEDRTPAGTTAFVSSVITHASQPICITPITRRVWPGFPEGSNSFTARRFLVPYMCGFNGWALFVDGADMLCRADVCELFKCPDHWKAVHVVKHPQYQTKAPRKYRGTPMEADNEDYPRKQWASVMLINCGHFAWRRVTPEFVRDANLMRLLQFTFIADDRIGDLPIEWNWLVDEYGENENAKLLHFTTGIPAFAQHANAPMASEWRAALAIATAVSV
jgi:hypothetical protein